MTHSESFISAIREAGLDCVPDVIEPGKMYRFPGEGKTKGNVSGWCRLFDDGLGGVFGDWSTGLYEVWQSKRDKPASPTERAESKQAAKRAAKARTEATQQQQQVAALKAAAIWTQLNPITDRFPYLHAKQVRPHGARLLASHTKAGGQMIYAPAMVVPLQNTEGQLRSLQFISKIGHKLFLKGGEITGNFYPMGSFSDNALICICEGFSTGATIRQETGRAVAVAFNAGNLKAVAISLRLKYPSAAITICGDNDRATPGNPGATKAKEAALAARARLAVVEFPDDAPVNLSDYNDLMTWNRKQRESA